MGVGANLQELENALNQRRKASAMSSAELAKSQEQQQAYTTKRSTGILSLIGESLFDSLRKKQTAGKHQEALEKAVQDATGVTRAEQDLAEYNRQYQMQQAQQQHARDRYEKGVDRDADQADKLEVQALKNEGSSLVTVNNDPGETAMAKALGKNFADSYTGWQNDAIAGAKMEPYLDKMEDLMQTMATGKPEAFMAKVGQYFGTEAGADYQQFMAAQIPVMLQMAEQISGPMTEKEWDMLRSGLGGPDKGPEANAEIIGLMRTAIERSKENFGAAQSFYGQNRTLEGFVPTYLKKREGKALGEPNPEIAKLEAEAEDAIKRGADPQAVQERLIELRKEYE
jgi:hypothetical protein